MIINRTLQLLPLLQKSPIFYLGHALIVSLDPIHKKLNNDIEIIPCMKFLELLWLDQIIVVV